MQLMCTRMCKSIIYIYLYIYISIYIYIYIDLYTHTHTHICMHIRTSGYNRERSFSFESGNPLRSSSPRILRP